MGQCRYSEHINEPQVPHVREFHQHYDLQILKDTYNVLDTFLLHIYLEDSRRYFDANPTVSKALNAPRLLSPCIYCRAIVLHMSQYIRCV